MKYTPPKPLHEWEVIDDIGTPFSVRIMDDETVVSAYVKYAHSSGCKITSWADFIDGKMNDLVSKTMGREILAEVLATLEKTT